MQTYVSHDPISFKQTILAVVSIPRRVNYNAKVAAVHTIQPDTSYKKNKEDIKRTYEVRSLVTPRERMH